jgi:murein DD-endopeptidase MepM/ murein hydrolase activator NlpD
MTRTAARRLVAIVGLAYCAGALTVHWTWRGPGDDLSADASKVSAEVRPADPPAHVEPSATSTIGNAATVDRLSRQGLLIPVEGVDRTDLRQSFAASRNGRAHEAIDILAPRDTPVRAVTAGRVAKLFTSARGGITLYQFDAAEQYCYYYAHFERYAEGIVEGARVERGQIVGYVGTSGNAPPDTPHLHFAIFEMGPDKRWWEGTPVDPYLALR